MDYKAIDKTQYRCYTPSLHLREARKIKLTKHSIGVILYLRSVPFFLLGFFQQ